MKKHTLLLITLLPLMAIAQTGGITLSPEGGLSMPSSGFNASRLLRQPGYQLGLHLDKKWKVFGLGLYGGLLSNGMEYDYQLPQSNSGLSIQRIQNIRQSQQRQLFLGLGPILSFRLSEKIGVEISSKFGFSKISYPDIEERVRLGTAQPEEYTLYRTSYETVAQTAYPMLLSSLRLHYGLGDRTSLFLSGSFNQVWNVRHSYSYLDGDFSPFMSNEELVSAFLSAPIVTEIRKCHFNTFGVSMGLNYTFGGKQDKGNPGEEEPEIITDQDSCLNALIRNGEFAAGKTRASGVNYWKTGYGNPKFLNTPGEGCFDPGFVEATGSQTAGDAIFQALDPINIIKSGKKYVVNIGVRFFDQSNTLDYARIRVIAFNNVLPSTGAHPVPGPNVAIIGRSGRVKDCGDWSVIEFPVWIANKNFSNIAVNVFTNEGTPATILIDNVTICEVSDTYDCDELQVDASGKPIPPPGYGNLPPGFNCVPEPEEDEYDNGSLQDLYGQLYGYDGTDNWYANATDKCFSVGGTLPDEVLNYNCDDSLKIEGINMTCDELKKILDEADVLKPSNMRPPPLPPIPPLQNNCAGDLPNDYDYMAFRGKDIIYIHGLQIGHLGARATYVLGADANWPDQPGEFYNTNGYYKEVAVDNWKPHIDYFLRGKGNRNRYLIVTYNCSQKLDVAVHAVLSQIREAMENGFGVEADPSDRRGTNCFGTSYVIVSTSTGSLVGDVALSIANKTKTDPSIQSKYGNIGFISDRCKGHMAVRGAMSGSNLATILLSTQVPSILAQKVTLGLTNGKYQLNFMAGTNKTLIQESILYDLVPQITRLKWGSYINDVPVPVMTISSGHPTALFGSLKFMLHPGFDDGVLSMDCSSGRINPSSTHPSQYIATSPIKVFDMGIPKIRAISYYLDQHVPSGGFGIASTPYLSPDGMVQPVQTVIPTPQFNNHFTFVQSTAEHVLPGKASYFNDCKYWPTTGLNGPSNWEEELAVSNGNLFSSGIVDKAIISEMRESIKDEHIFFPFLKIKIRHGVPKLTIYWKKFYIWKRTYHTLNDNCMYDCDYGYKYLFQN